MTLPKSDLSRLAASWQRAMVSDLSRECPDLGIEQRYRAARSLILRLVALYLCEQRGILKAGQLIALRQNPNIETNLLQLWQTLHIPESSSQIDCLPDSLLSCLIDSLYRHSLPPDADEIAVLGQVYEALLAAEAHSSCSSQRKSGGVYYTPQPIVSYILQNTLSTFRHQPSLTLTLLDPACGGGIFLISAYQMLLDWQLRAYLVQDMQAAMEKQQIELGNNGEWRLTFAVRSRILLSHIYGVDLDPQAVAITKLALWLKLLEGDRLSTAKNRLPDLTHNVQCRDALIDSEILQAGRFDLVIGNPPYLDSETMTAHSPHYRQYCAAKYQTARGNWDLFCVFIEKALTLCKPGGFTSLVVPNKLASAPYAAMARSLLVRQARLLSIRDYACVSAFRASVYPLVYVAQVVPPNSAPVRYEQMQSLDQVNCRGWLRLSDSAQPWRLGLRVQSDWIDRIQTRCTILGEMAQVTGAATVAEAYALQPWIQDGAATAGDLRLVNSGTIDRYTWLWGKKPLRYLGQTYLHPVIPAGSISQLSVRRRQQAQQPKIIVAGMSQVLECAFDAGGILAGKSTSVIASALDWRFLLGLLNSRLLSVYFRTCFAGNRLQGGYFRVGAPQLRQLPIPNLLEVAQCFYEPLITGVDDRIRQQLGLQQAAQQDAAIDQLVYQLYGLTDAEIRAIENPLEKSCGDLAVLE